jgi:MFS family permease
MSEAVTIEEKTFCEVHPDRETALRCNKCNRYMCVQCAVSTPVGYRCRECVRGQERQFFRANVGDNWILAAVCAVLTGIGAALMGQIGMYGWYLILIAGAPVGGFISEAAFRAVGKRRGMNYDLFGAGGAIVGGLMGAFIPEWLYWSNLMNQALERFNGEIPPEIAASLNPDLSWLLTSQADALVFVGVVVVVIYLRFRIKRAA